LPLGRLLGPQTDKRFAFGARLPKHHHGAKRLRIHTGDQVNVPGVVFLPKLSAPVPVVRRQRAIFDVPAFQVTPVHFACQGNRKPFSQVHHPSRKWCRHPCHLGCKTGV
jgi:hypothetical protein